VHYTQQQQNKLHEAAGPDSLMEVKIAIGLEQKSAERLRGNLITQQLCHQYLYEIWIPVYRQNLRYRY
jgi:hypothetical protein